VAELLTVQALFTLFMLVLLQAVLGFDNLLYIAIESNKVGDEDDAKKVRKWGIGIAVVLRIVLLFVIVKLFALLAEPLFGIHMKGFLEGDFRRETHGCRGDYLDCPDESRVLCRLNLVSHGDCEC